MTGPSLPTSDTFHTQSTPMTTSHAFPRRATLGLFTFGLMVLLAVSQAATGVGAAPPPPPVDTVTAVTFTIRDNCATQTTYDLQIGGVSVGAPSASDGTCDGNNLGQPRTLTVTDPAVLGSFPDLNAPYCSTFSINSFDPCTDNGWGGD